VGRSKPTVAVSGARVRIVLSRDYPCLRAGAGFRAWIAPSFGDIFFENSFKNGALAIVLAHEQVAALREMLHVQPGMEMTIDLPSQTVSAGSQVLQFAVDPFRKECLLEGIDEIALTLRYEQAIADYERMRGIA